MRLIVVFNRSSGALLGQDADALALEVKTILKNHGHDVTTELADGAAVVKTLTRARANADAVIVGGGDGTIASAAQALIGTDTALGVLPLGTMNLFARDLGLPLAVKDAATALAGAAPKLIDVGEVNGKVFLCTSSLGIFSLLARRRERQRHDPNPLKWIGAIGATIVALGRQTPFSILLRNENGAMRVRTRAVVISNNAYDGGIFGPSLKRPILDSGKLCVYVTRKHSAWGMLFLFAELFIGNWMQDPEIEMRPLARMFVHSRRPHLSVMNDGEVLLLKTPLRYRIRPRSLKVLVPQ